MLSLPEWLILPLQLVYLGLLLVTVIQISTERNLSRGWKTTWLILLILLPLFAMMYWLGNAGNLRMLTFGRGSR